MYPNLHKHHKVQFKSRIKVIEYLYDYMVMFESPLSTRANKLRSVSFVHVWIRHTFIEYLN